MTAAENKTRATGQDVAAHLAAIDNGQRRQDALALSALMQQITGEPPVMWGPSIVGFGSCHYRYASGREGDMCLTGFAARKNEFSIYLSCNGPDPAALLQRLGKHRMGKGCLYIKRLADVDLAVLRQLISEAVQGLRDRYGPGAAALPA